MKIDNAPTNALLASALILRASALSSAETSFGCSDSDNFSISGEGGTDEGGVEAVTLGDELVDEEVLIVAVRVKAIKNSTST